MVWCTIAVRLSCARPAPSVQRCRRRGLLGGGGAAFAASSLAGMCGFCLAPKLRRATGACCADVAALGVLAGGGWQRVCAAAPHLRLVPRAHDGAAVRVSRSPALHLSCPSARKRSARAGGLEPAWRQHLLQPVSCIPVSCFAPAPALNLSLIILRPFTGGVDKWLLGTRVSARRCSLLLLEDFSPQTLAGKYTQVLGKRARGMAAAAAWHPALPACPFFRKHVCNLLS